MIVGPFSSGVAVGGNGVATANQTGITKTSGMVMGVYVKYNDAPPAGTTDVTIATLGTYPSAPARTILAITNAATDGWFYPRVEVCSTAGAALGEYTLIPIDDKIKVTIAQANAADNVEVWLDIIPS